MDKDPLRIVWLSSYPKSGNTWLRFFLTHLVYGDKADSSNVINYIPEVGGGDEPKEIEDNYSGTTLVKTHMVYSPHLPLLNKTAGFIYVVRHPLDVFLSNLNYHMLKLYEDFECTEEQYIMYHYLYPYLHEEGDPHWKPYGYGSWSENVSSWLNASGKHPGLIIRYEDMLNNPIPIAESINSYLNLRKSRKEIINSLEFSSFDNMKKMEERDIEKNRDSFFSSELNEKGFKEGYRFMNKGKKNQKHTLPPLQRKQLMELFKGIRDPLAYY